MVVALITLTDAQHPPPSTVLEITAVSRGSFTLPHVFTSTAVKSNATLVNTNLKSLGLVHRPVLDNVAPKFTLIEIPGGSIGREGGVSRVVVKVVVREA